MDQTTYETWRYTVRPGKADGVFLVIDGPTMPSKWTPMKPSDTVPGEWHATADIDPGKTRVRYFTADDGAYLNCGNVGLVGKRATNSTSASLAASA